MIDLCEMKILSKMKNAAITPVIDDPLDSFFHELYELPERFIFGIEDNKSKTVLLRPAKILQRSLELLPSVRNIFTVLRQF